jgi:hypothetical protein
MKTIDAPGTAQTALSCCHVQYIHFTYSTLTAIMHKKKISPKSKDEVRRAVTTPTRSSAQMTNDV